MIGRRRALAGCALGAASLLLPGAGARAAGPVLQVGPGRAVKTLGVAAWAATPGTRIEVDAGEYRGDVAVWSRDDVELQAVGGRVRLMADGAAMEGKGIWVVRAQRMTADGFDFEGAAVPAHNGAGIRLETGSLRVRNCTFIRNETGVLTSNRGDVELDVEDCEFSHNTQPDGQSHLLYVGAIKRLAVTGSYFHHGLVGHLLKSRAARNLIAYNRLTDEAEGSASYELEFANGGIAHVIGNLIQQSALSQNPHLVSFGAEGYSWLANEIYLAHNTLVDDMAQGGIFLRARAGAGAVRVVNNLLAGAGQWNVGANADMNNNLTLVRSALPTSGADAYHATRDALERLRAIDGGSARDVALTPNRQYAHPHRTLPLRTPPRWVGALQLP